MKYIVTYIIISLVFLSCVREKEYYADFVEQDFLYSILEGNHPAEVILYRSSPFGDITNFTDLPFIENATIEIITEDKSWILEPTEWKIPFFNGVFQDSIFIYGYKNPTKVEYGKEYEIEITYDKKVVKGKTLVPLRPKITQANLDSTFNGLRYEYYIDFIIEDIQPNNFLYFNFNFKYHYISQYSYLDGNGNTIEVSDTFNIDYDNFYNDNINTSELRAGMPFRFKISDVTPLVGDKDKPYELKFTFFNYLPDAERFRKQGKTLNLFGEINPFIEPDVPYSNVSTINGVFSSYSKSKLVTVLVFPKR